MARINIDDCCCHNCEQPLDDIGVWVEVLEPLSDWELRVRSWAMKPGQQMEPGQQMKTVTRPLCRKCYTFADMQATVQLVCDGCGFKAVVPKWLEQRFRLTHGYDYADWVCSRRCWMRRHRKDRHWKSRICEVCGEHFDSTRVDARFCSNQYRQRQYRQRLGCAV